jgi:hypothetical protein
MVTPHTPLTGSFLREISLNLSWATWPGDARLG